MSVEASPDISVVIPVYNEEEGLPFLFERLYPALDALGRSYEVVFVDDGSRDRSVAALREQFQRRPEVTRVVVLARNAGQHLAILAAFQQTRGHYVITLDADLQNPPEEIARIIAAMDAGADAKARPPSTSPTRVACCAATTAASSMRSTAAAR